MVRSLDVRCSEKLEGHVLLMNGDRKLDGLLSMNAGFSTAFCDAKKECVHDPESALLKRIIEKRLILRIDEHGLRSGTRPQFCQFCAHGDRQLARDLFRG